MFQKACKAIETGAETRLESIPEVIYVLMKSVGVNRIDIATALTDLFWMMLLYRRRNWFSMPYPYSQK